MPSRDHFRVHSTDDLSAPGVDGARSICRAACGGCAAPGAPRARARDAAQPGQVSLSAVRLHGRRPAARSVVDAGRVPAVGRRGREGGGGREGGRRPRRAAVRPAGRARTRSARRLGCRTRRCSPRCARSSRKCRACSSSPTSACASTRRTATAACSSTARSSTTPPSSSSRAPRCRTRRPAPTSSRRPT